MARTKPRALRWWFTGLAAVLSALVVAVAVTAADSVTEHRGVTAYAEAERPPPISAPSESAAPAPAPRSAGSTPADAPRFPDAGLEHDFTALGVAVHDRHAGETVLRDGADRQFTSASLVKLLVAFEALEHHARTVDIHTMLARSDDDIAGLLWVRHGGPEIVTTWAQRLDLPGTAPPAQANRWGDTLTTADDVVAVYRYLLTDAPADVRELVLGGLRAATPLGADGFDQSFGIPDATGEAGAVKQGWACCLPDRVLHSTGVVGAHDRYVVVVLTRSPSTVGWETASADVTDVVTQVLNALPE
ncbi:hypothetical protein B1813_12510 [Saccharomonospora piscinae]|uniref:Beta-lactamase class A n=1 Tax=Saccharomonospora piscinae TaxID=687388 RepID=A0A1V9A7M8_SACPI|nr:hypothetical protein [Saccharomonospora piscinae]OQO92934.1 hypothetical protein B1813_12510 [Saccharomonospora piscinae]